MAAVNDKIYSVTVKAAAARTPRQGLSLSWWILIAPTLAALGAPGRASAQATHGLFEEAHISA
jgi:hypothetical protein